MKPPNNFKNHRILLVHDESEANHVWSYLLLKQGLEVTESGSIAKTLETPDKESFNLTLINFYNSWEDAVFLCRRLREEIVNPILLFTAVTDEQSLLNGYAAGADECITKPITHRLFLAKINAWLRRSKPAYIATPQRPETGELQMDTVTRQIITAKGKKIKLTNLEFRVLHLLMSNKGQMIETSVIVNRVWGHNESNDGVLLKNVIYRLRQKIEDDPSRPRYLQTVNGGYTFRSA